MLLQALEQFNVLNINILWYLNIPSYVLVILVILFILGYFYLFLTDELLYLCKKTGLNSIIIFSYLFILDIIKQIIGNKGIPYLPFILCIFIYIYLSNITGLVGYNIQLTSHIVANLGISLMLFLGIVFLGIKHLKLKYLNQFIPKDAPAQLYHFLICIEIVSYIIRPFTLSIRLFANMFSGHVLLYVIISFVIAILEKKLIILQSLGIILPVLLLFFIMCLEFLIMFLQAYVFIILLCVYLNDSLNSH